ncbi:hypothetical protein PoB_005827100 [Plakobranchus ocellatus]|uniref:Uncharacterized protein n=1 Tax=Plakobranchus ocellatus TaxID=259542 RepID=A0AAV4C8Y4_9GAST|nr:hypothetical protein PoB_005827100 [Plakobranchus ocellatus]
MYFSYPHNFPWILHRLISDSSPNGSRISTDRPHPNRAYNYTDVNLASGSSQTPPLPPPPSASVYPGPAGDAPYEYMSVRQAQNVVNSNQAPSDGGSGSYPASPPHHQNSPQQQRYLQQSNRAISFDSAFPQGPPPPVPPPPPDFPDFHPPPPHHHHHHHHQHHHHHPPGINNSSNAAAYANEIYMDQADMVRARQGNPYTRTSYQDPYAQPHRQRVEEAPYRAEGSSPMERASYHNRTDDEQLLELQQSKHRAKSESRLADLSPRHQHRHRHRMPGHAHLPEARSYKVHDKAGPPVFLHLYVYEASLPSLTLSVNSCIVYEHAPVCPPQHQHRHRHRMPGHAHLPEARSYKVHDKAGPPVYL